MPLIVRCDVDAIVPEERRGRWLVWKHIKKPPFEWNPLRVQALPLVGRHNTDLCTPQESDLNANFLDFLLENPTEIPAQWVLRKNPSRIIFRGTLFLNYEGFVFARFLASETKSWGIIQVDGMAWEDPTTARLGFSKANPIGDFLAMYAS